MIEHLIDEALAYQEAEGLNCRPGAIPQRMQTGRRDNDWVYWKSIPSEVTDSDIKDIEGMLGAKFSRQYVQLLKHKHFIEVHIGEVSLLSHPCDTWQGILLKSAFDGYPREFLIDKGYLPFADFSDWGLWCFNLNEANAEGEHPVYLWDHERPEEFTKVADDLQSALMQQRLEQQGRDDSH